MEEADQEKKSWAWIASNYSRAEKEESAMSGTKAMNERTTEKFEADEQSVLLSKSWAGELAPRDLRRKIKRSVERHQNDSSGIRIEKTLFDLREKISSGGIETSRNQERRDLSIREQRHRKRGRHHRDAKALSPLRSPRTERSERYNILEMDNSRSHRFTSSQPGRSSGPDDSPSRLRYSRHVRQTDTLRESTSIENTRSTPRHRASDLEESENDSTPVLNKISSQDDRIPGSRRRLQLPPEERDECELEGSDSGSENTNEQEDDEARLARKEKDIQYGKNSEAYKLYRSVMYKGQRSGDLKLHPRTPNKMTKCSRRNWDQQIRLWKLRLHSWADTYKEAASGEKKQFVFPDELENMDIREKENATVTEVEENADLDDDESFLDHLDLDFDAAEINDKVRISDSV